MNKRVIYISIGGALLLAIIGYAIYANIASKTVASNANANSNTETQAKQQFVTALGRIEPQDEVINLTAPSGVSGAIVTELKVAEGDLVNEGEIVALLDGFEQNLATVNEARTRVEISRRKLDQIKVGAKSGDLVAQDAQTEKLADELRNAREQLRWAENPSRETPLPEYADVKRLEAELENAQSEEKRTQNDDSPLAEYVAIERLEKELANAQTEFKRAEKLVEKGDISRSEFDTRRLSVETFQKEIKRTRAAWQTVQKDKRLAVQTISRDLQKAHGILQTTVNDKRLAVETLQRDLERSKASYSSLAEVRPTDIAAAEAEVENAEANVDKALADLELRKVKTYTSGKVLKIYARPGETIGSDGVLELGNTETMFAVAEVFEADIAKIKTGQNAEITVRTSGEKFSGTVVQIGSMIKKSDNLDTDPVADVDARVVEVRVKLNAEASKQLAKLTNLRVDVRIALN
ncbi:MAG: HlyD family efflux transporter periplasmic adaptor subunit [Pyrinomonadaceae bacterium]|nr:HlyD family efflux transporter periplasmic adaptor subunit [Pyrinomonadaceae bacterium]